MTKDQISKKEMIEAVLSYMDSNAQKWNALAKVGQFKNMLSDTMEAINTAAMDQQRTKVAMSKNKSILKKTIAEKADILNDLVECFASVEGLAELESRMSDAYSSLVRKNEEEFVIKIKEVIAEAENNAAVLKENYGMTDAQIEDLKNDLNKFNELRGTPRAYVISSVQSTKELDTLFREATNIINNQLDKVMKIFKRRDPRFYNGYLASRVIVG